MVTRRRRDPMRLRTAIATTTVALFMTCGPALAADEQKVSLDQVPAPVRATAEKEAKGGAIAEVTKETEKGKTFYEAHITKDGKDRYVHIREDGKVLKRENAKKEAKEDAKEAKPATK
jgi:uncharacterized membrane protein YkoI